MTNLVLTAIGDEREGLVSALSSALDSHGGNWLDSQFARLAGKFAGIVLVDVPQERAAAFEQATAALLPEVGLKVEVTPAAGPATLPAGEEAGLLTLVLIGLDRPGMVRQVTTALAEQHVSIASFRSWTSDAPQGGGLLFEAECMVSLPDGVDPEALRSALEPIADELMVDIEFTTDGAPSPDRAAPSPPL